MARLGSRLPIPSSGFHLGQMVYVRATAEKSGGFVSPCLSMAGVGGMVDGRDARHLPAILTVENRDGMDVEI